MRLAELPFDHLLMQLGLLEHVPDFTVHPTTPPSPGNLSSPARYSNATVNIASDPCY